MTDHSALIERLELHAKDANTLELHGLADHITQAAAALRDLTEWRPVQSHPAYSVSRHGEVRKGDRLIGLWANGRGYMSARLSGPRVTASVHRLVAQAFLSPDPSRPFVNHKNNDRSDNRVENLEWCTQAENIQHAARLGLMHRSPPSGGRSPRASLSDEQAGAIRKAVREGKTYSEVAGSFGVSKRTVGRIINNQYYIPLPSAPNQAKEAGE